MSAVNKHREYKFGGTEIQFAHACFGRGKRPVKYAPFRGALSAEILDMTKDALCTRKSQMNRMNASIKNQLKACTEYVATPPAQGRTFLQRGDSTRPLRLSHVRIVAK